MPPQGAFVIWDWLWFDDIDHVSETSSEDIRALSPSIDSCGTSDSHTTSSPEPMQLHTINFKCIGCTRDHQSQQILQEVSQKLDIDEEVLVNLYPEPDNKFDNKAIAFKCFISGKWHRIGYVVKEVLTDVHDAMKKNLITAVKFAWVKYIVTWTRSGPGYFAGISITRKGMWSKEVCQSASTR